MKEATIHSLMVTDLRLASHTARGLFGTKHLPILGTNDPIRAKFMRRAHILGIEAVSYTHLTLPTKRIV